MTQQTVAICSFGLWRERRELAQILADYGAPRPGWPHGRAPAGLAAIAGWGHRPTADAARRAAQRWQLPYLALEDGFLRSYELGVRRGRRLSWAVDPLGVYYDASAPSALENLIADYASITDSELADADELMRLMRAHGLGKYNAAPDLPESDPLGRARPLVLVVDQTAGDASVAAGAADAQTFRAMLQAACAENPGAEIRVRVHPDVVAGKRRGYLLDEARRLGIALEARACSWASLVRRAQRVYVATSQAGLEALIHGVPVTCFGLPFYAGWGLSDDRQQCARRQARPSLRALVAAAYLSYCRYLDPASGARCDALTVARHLAACRQRDARNDAPIAVLGIRPWKRWQITPFLRGPQARVRYVKTADAALHSQRRHGGRIAVWAAREPDGLAAAAAAQGAPLWRIEDGFLRSVGLGSNHVAGCSLVIDPLGIYFDPRQPSRLEQRIEQGGFDVAELQRAQRLRAALIARGLTKYNYGARAPLQLGGAPGQRRILVPGQVEDDASVRYGSPEVLGNLALLERVRAAAPDAWIVYKPHPDTEVGNRVGRVARSDALRFANEIIDGASVVALFGQVDEVHTMTSLVGFEALLRGIPVSTYGLPFYAGWGLTRDLLTLPRRQWRATLDELVAAALIEYPGYADLSRGVLCSVEQIVEQLHAAAARPVKAPPRALMLLIGLWRSWRGARA